MSHLATKCDCGRTIHFPKDAPLGYQWICKECGKKWILSTHGKPTHDTRSKRPPQQEPQTRPSNSNNSGSGCVFVGFILFSTIAGSAYKIIEYLFT